MALSLMACLVLSSGCDLPEPDPPRTNDTLTATELAALETVFGCDVVALSLNSGTNRTIDGSDCTLANGHRVEYVAFKLANAAMPLSVTMTSTEVDAYVILFDGASNRLGENDDITPDQTDALLEIDLAPGIYVVGATTFEADEEGAYRLDVTG